MISILFAVYQALSTMFSPAEATLVFAGDAMMHQGQIDAARRSDGRYDFSEYFTAIADGVRAADYAVVNLETPLGGSPYAGYPCFCAPDSYADALTDAGFDLFLTANNHTLDRNDRGLRRTINVLDGRGIPHVGTYRDAAQRDSLLPVVKDIKGFKVGFLNYTYGTNGITARAGAVVDYIDTALIRRDLRGLRGAGAEITCVAVHWGDEYHLLPNRSQKQLAQMLVDEGVDLVIGGHPHVIQPMEMRTDTAGRQQLVVYSLGNFISNMRKPDTRGGALVYVTLGRDSQGKARVERAEYDLVFTVPADGRHNFHLLPADTCAQWREAHNRQWRSRADAFERSATAIFDGHNIDVPRRGVTHDN